jgi:hypothetical protein
MKRTKPTILFAACVAALSLSLRPVAGANDAPKAALVTYSKDIAPILYKSCAECHRPGELAPFSVLSYKDVRPWVKSIKEQVAKREMPPWHADPQHGKWRNDRSLSQREIDAIVAWADTGAPEGNAKDLPPAPKFSTDGWHIGKPDAAFSIPEQAVPAEGVVAYQYLTVPANFSEDKWIQAAEVRSSGREVVHHVIVFVQSSEGGGPGSEQGLLVGFAPGEQPAVFPPGYARRVPAGAKLIFQMHYTPNGKAAKDVTTVGLVFAKEPVKHQVLTRGVLNMRFEIPPGANAHEVRSTHTFNADAHITSFMPHMHLRGKDFSYIAHFPDGTSKTLLSVPRYDFNWQAYYVPEQPIAMPKGARLECVAHFDNSTANKFNPDPTKPVKWGDQTWEEMMIGWISFHYDKPAAAGSASRSEK